MPSLKKFLPLIFICLISVTFSQQVTGLSGWNIFLDPGHSQKENPGIYGYSEAEKNLRVALHLRQLLLDNTDIDTVYCSRYTDQDYIDLGPRSTMANNLGASWFHSIHSDAGDASLNSTLLLWGQYYDGREKVPNGGKAMSDIMVVNLTNGMRTTTRGSYGDCTFYSYSTYCATSGGPYLSVNRNTVMPSELSEAGFHTNPRQNQLNMNAEYKRLEAYTFFWSILQFHGIPRPKVGILTGIISDLESGTPLNGATAQVGDKTYTTDTYESLFYKYTTDPNQLSNGFYWFEDLPNDTLTLIVSCPQYYNDTSRVFIKDNFFTFKDVRLISKKPPTVETTSPADGDTSFYIWNDIVINFSRAMHKASVEANFSLSPAVPGTFKWKNSDKQLLFHSDSLKAKSYYTLCVGGAAMDKYGHPFDGNKDGVGGDDYVITFKTGPEDIFPPKVFNIYPPQVGSNIEPHPIINIVMDELLDTTSITSNSITLTRVSNGSLVSGNLRFYNLANRTVLAFFPAEALAPNELYITRLQPGLKDRFGNSTTATTSYSFRTGNYTYTNTTIIDNFDINLTTNWYSPEQSGSTTGYLPSVTSRGENTTYINLLTGSTKSMQLSYGWDTTQTTWLIREYLNTGTPRNVLFDKSYILQVYVFGDGSGNKFRFAVDKNYPSTAASDHEVSPWYEITWYGWRLVSWDMTNDGCGTWLGNGQLTGTLRFDSFQLTYKPGAPITGAFYFDDLRLVKKVALGVTPPQPTLADQPSLFPNFPNPFNPRTTIPFYLPTRALVQLDVYDLLGNHVTNLCRDYLESGYHQFDFEAGKFASGIYFYTLKTGSTTLTRKMQLMK